MIGKFIALLMFPVGFFLGLAGLALAQLFALPGWIAALVAALVVAVFLFLDVLTDFLFDSLWLWMVRALTGRRENIWTRIARVRGLDWPSRVAAVAGLSAAILSTQFWTFSAILSAFRWL